MISSWRNQGNQRRYAREVLRRVAVIKVAQRSGISLSSIRNAMAALPGGRVPTVEDWQKMSAGWKADLSDRIMRLTRLRDQLDRCIGCGCLSLGVCPLRNPWSKLSKLGPGAQVLDPNVAIDRELTLAAVECSLARVRRTDTYPSGILSKSSGGWPLGRSRMSSALAIKAALALGRCANHSSC